MNREDFINQLLTNRGLNPEDLVRKRYRTVPDIKAKDLFGIIYDKETVKGIAAYYHVSLNTINRLMKSIFPEVTITGGSRTWRYYLLNLLSHKMCTDCEVIKPKTEFYAGYNVETRSTCKICDTIRSGKRRAVIANAIEPDSDLTIIEQIYLNCPKDYHVDHIQPLSKGGKHHQNNLCYLPARDNLLKSNKLPETVPHIMDKAIYPKF